MQSIMDLRELVERAPKVLPVKWFHRSTHELKTAPRVQFLAQVERPSKGACCLSVSQTGAQLAVIKGFIFTDSNRLTQSNEKPRTLQQLAD